MMPISSIRARTSSLFIGANPLRNVGVRVAEE
jgi:hypothetical protein